MNNTSLRLAMLLALTLSGANTTALPAAAKLGMPFSDHMVLQSGVPVPVWGTAAPGEKITVEFAGQTHSATADADDGKWRVTLAPLQASAAPGTLAVRDSGGGTRLGDVLVGEVWICSGQSNMRFALGRQAEPRGATAPLLYPHALANSSNPRIRLLNVSGGTPENRRWAVCGPETAKAFSATGYFFGAALERARDIPVGLIDLGQGGAAIRVFIPKKTFEADPRFDPPSASPKAKSPKIAGSRFEKDMKPLAPFAVRGVLWYQGESDASRAAIYPEMLRVMIAEWRRALESPALPFLIVQLPPWERRRTDKPDAMPAAKWPELRQAQLQFTKTEPHTALAVIADCGERLDIHPRRKREVGERLALVARAKVYGEPVGHTGPAPVFCEARSDSELVMRFTHTEGGLFARAGQLDNFEVAGGDENFVPAQATVSGYDSITIAFPPGMKPRCVRYAWAGWFEPSLFNSNGFPAGPFVFDLRE